MLYTAYSLIMLKFNNFLFKKKDILNINYWDVFKINFNYSVLNLFFTWSVLFLIYPKKEIRTPAATAEPITPEILLDIQYCRI